MKTTIYTNGKALFTLENFTPSGAVSPVNGIKIHSKMSDLKRRTMHSNGNLHYVFGIDNLKHLKDVNLKRNKKYGKFTIS